MSGNISFEIKMLSKYRLLNIDGKSKALPFLAPKNATPISGIFISVAGNKNVKQIQIT